MVKKYYSDANSYWQVRENPNLLMSLYEAFPLWKKICMYYQEQPLPVFQHFVVSLKKQDRPKRGCYSYRHYSTLMDPLTRIILENDVEFVQLLIGSPANFTALTYPYFPRGLGNARVSVILGNALHLATRDAMEKMIDE